MRALSNADFLSLWESGRRLHSLDRGLLAVRASLSEPAEENVADWPLGRRNQALAELHRSYFGSRLQGWTKCGQCGEKLEFGLDCRSLIERQRERSADQILEPIVAKGCSFRVPTSRDLARVAREIDAEAAALRLMECCRIGDGGDAMEWSREELEQLGEKMIAADPLAEILLSFECPACKAAREQALDLPAFLWAELEAFAKRMLYEIHLLASAYGWSEREILSLSESRRAAYLEMVQA
ncbi:MAG: hypothetical protein WBE38_05875 [Terracidiphilus sp.]|jgi:hypothetical protein